MVGELLRQARERQKLSIKDVEQGTSIRSLYLEAIENGNYDKLPGEVYTKGFIKNYANFLKLDGNSFVRQYLDEKAPPVTEVASDVKSEVNSAPVEAVKEPSTTAKEVSEPEMKIKTPRLEREKSGGSGILVAAVLLIAAIAGGIWYYFNYIEGTEIAQKPSVQIEQVNKNESESVNKSVSSTPTASASTPENKQVASDDKQTANGLNVQAKFNDRCWTQVIVDGRLAYEGTAEAGQVLSWQASDRINITAGNAGAVEFIENGSNLGIAGAVGDVIEKTFTRR